MPPKVNEPVTIEASELLETLTHAATTNKNADFRMQKTPGTLSLQNELASLQGGPQYQGPDQQSQLKLPVFPVFGIQLSLSANRARG